MEDPQDLSGKEVKIDVMVGRRCLRILVNDPMPVVRYHLPAGDPKPYVSIKENVVRISLDGYERSLEFSMLGDRLLISTDLRPWEHILGLGEKALPLDRRRRRIAMWNYDNWGYQEGVDPLYISIPFAMMISREKAFGIFVNSPGYLVFDMGVSEYDKVLIDVWDASVEVYAILGTPKEVLEVYTSITGRPFIPPRWALGHQISRYSYYPQDLVIEIVDRVLEYAPLDAVYLDIDYMDSYKIFTWDPKRFPDPRKLSEELHRRGVRLITIIDPYVKIEPEYDVFRESLDLLVRRASGELYISRGWPGYSGIPDFFNKETRDWWASRIERWARKYGVDGIWLDMNEPTVFNIRPPVKPMTKSIFQALEDLLATLSEAVERVRAVNRYPVLLKRPEDMLDRSLEADAVHRLDDRRILSHWRVRNAYPLFQAMATYEGLKRVVEKPFILSRAGYPGIQSYAAVWTGDNIGSWEHLKLSIKMILGLSISGIAWAGVDIGGFVGHTDPELLARWYQVCALFPLYRVHKMKGGSDSEIFALPPKYREMAIKAIKLRYSLIPYLWHLAWEAHLTGLPIVRPLALEFPEDDEAYSIDDQYMVGPNLLYAPIVEKGAKGREMYLPRGIWRSFWRDLEIEGPKWIYSEEDMPLYIRSGSAIPTSEGLMIYGRGSWKIYQGENGEAIEISREEDHIKIVGEAETPNKILLLGEKIRGARIEDIDIEVRVEEPWRSWIIIPKTVKKHLTVEIH